MYYRFIYECSCKRGTSIRVTEEEITNKLYEKNIVCGICGNTFSLFEGVRNAFASRNPFIVLQIANKFSQFYNVEITIGITKKIEFKEPFKETPKIFLTPNAPVSIKTGAVSQNYFTIISSTIEGHDDIKKCEIDWGAYGKEDLVSIPFWKEILNNSVDHRLAFNYRSEIIDLCTTTEIFLNHYFSVQLKQKGWKENLIEQILELNLWKKIDIGYTAIKGDKLQNIDTKLYNDYTGILRKNRNDVVHKGLDKTEDESIMCRLSTYDLIIKTEPMNIKYFSSAQSIQ